MRQSLAVSLQFWTYKPTKWRRYLIQSQLQKAVVDRRWGTEGCRSLRTKSGYPHGTISTPSVRSRHCRRIRILNTHWRPWLEPWREPTVSTCLRNMNYTTTDESRLQRCFISCTPWGSVEHSGADSLSETPRLSSRRGLHDS